MSGATVGKTGYYTLNQPALLNQRVGKFVFNNSKIISKYLFHYINSKLFFNRILNYAYGCAQPNISAKQIEEMIIPLPPIGVQKRIALNIDSITKIINLRKQRLTELDILIKSRFVEMFGDGCSFKPMRLSDIALIAGGLTKDTRNQLRELIKFIIEDNASGVIYTNLSDEIIGIKEGRKLREAYDFDDYRLKVNRYIEDNKNNIAIHKLRNNLPLTDIDYKTLEHIFTGELGTREDYEREFGKTPFGLLVRKVAKLEPEAANKVFSDFINDQNLNQKQIVFIRKIIDYITQNGYVENTAELFRPPFDKPASFIKLFDSVSQKRIVELLEQVKNNALAVSM